MGYLMIMNYILGFLIPHTQYKFSIYDKLREIKAN